MAATMAGQLESSVLPSGNYHVMPCPDPDDLNWQALWATWQQARDCLRLKQWVGGVHSD